eukprot:Skav232522  [mRNA]  locus=scaffold1096:1054611:1057742:- [translate_table: standard]
MFHRNITTKLDINSQDFTEAIRNKKHTEGECWFNALIDHYEKTLMSSKKWESKRMTKQKMLELINKTDEEFLRDGASVNDMKTIFEYFKIPARIYKMAGSIVYKYDPEVKNKNVPAFYGVIKDKHIYTMNNDIMSLSQKNLTEDRVMAQKASPHFHLSKREKPVEFITFRSTNDILNILKENEQRENEDKEKEFNLFCPDVFDLNEVYCDFKKAGYTPKIFCHMGNITAMKMEFNGVIFNLRHRQLIAGDAVDTYATIDNVKMFNRMNSAMFKFNKDLFNPSRKSFYNEDDVKILDTMRTIVPNGVLKEYKKDNLMKTDLIEIDLRKAFTYAFISMRHIPVFSEFDVWRHYDSSKHDINKLNNLTLYFVRSKKRNLFFNKIYSLVYGKFLKQLNLKDVEIVCYKVPSNIYKVDYRKLVNELWEDDISDDEHLDKAVKKLVGNIMFGMLEKGQNTNYKTLDFKNITEAFWYQEQYGGQINTITDNDNTYYCLNIVDEATLVDGYRYVKELLLQHHNHKMFSAYVTLLQNKINVYSVKTDAFVISRADLDKTKTLLNFGEGFGDWRSVDEFNLSFKNYVVQPNKMIEVVEPSCETLTVEDEWNTKQIIEDHILPNKRLMIRGDVAGTGKSFICKSMDDMGYKVLFVVHSNELGQQCGCDWVTINKFFGIAFGDERLEPFDSSGYDVIVFDEIYFHNVSKWAMIWDFERKHPDKIILATGDTNQLKSPEHISNVVPFEEYANHCINLIFKKNIMLYECKRVKTVEDRQMIKDVKRLIYDGLPFQTIIDRHFGWTEEILMTDNSIGYTNRTCRVVSKRVREMKGIKEEYVVGEELICRKYMKVKGKKLNVNYKYEVLEVGDKEVMLRHTATDHKVSINIDVVRKNFIYAYCYTAHSKQGCSVDGEVVIYDWKHRYADKNWFWTAVTRARDFSKVKFFKYDDDDERNEIERTMEMDYFNNKVLNYKQQDTKANRETVSEEYIDAKFLSNLINTPCECCGDVLTLEVDKGKVTSNITAQRINNEVGHFKSNCKGLCDWCNKGLSDKNSI